MRTTITIDDDLYRRLKAEAALSGQTVGQLIEQGAREVLRPRPRHVDLAELPVFGGSGVLPGVDLSDAAGLRTAMDEDVGLDALR